METPLTAPINQGDKLRQRIGIALEKSGVPKNLIQVALGHPGTGLEDEFVASIVKYAKKASGIVTPVRAEDSGLIPNGWSVYVRKGVWQDFPEGDVDLAKLDYSACPVHEGKEYVGSESMMKRARELGAIGSLGFAAELLKAQDEGKEIFPVESRGVHYFIMPLTELRGDVGSGGVAFFHWDGRRWRLRFDWLGRSFDRRDRFVRRSE